MQGKTDVYFVKPSPRISRTGGSLRLVNTGEAPVTEPMRILIVDAHPVFRYGLGELLRTQADFNVVCATATANEAVELLDRLKPEILLLDVSIARAAGWDTLRCLRRVRHQVRTILVATAIAQDELAITQTLGAQGLILRDTPVPDVL